VLQVEPNLIRALPFLTRWWSKAVISGPDREPQAYLYRLSFLSYCLFKFIDAKSARTIATVKRQPLQIFHKYRVKINNEPLRISQLNEADLGDDILEKTKPKLNLHPLVLLIPPVYKSLADRQYGIGFAFIKLLILLGAKIYAKLTGKQTNKS